MFNINYSQVTFDVITINLVYLAVKKSVTAKLHEPLSIHLTICNAIYTNCTNHFCIWVAFRLFLKTNMPKGYLFSSIFNVRHNEQKHVNLDKFCFEKYLLIWQLSKKKKVFFLNKVKVQCSQCHLMINTKQTFCSVQYVTNQM